MFRFISYFTFIGWVVCLTLWFTNTLSIWFFVGLLIATAGLNVLHNLFNPTPQQQAAVNFFGSLPKEIQDSLNSGETVVIDTRSRSERERNPIPKINGDQT